MLPLSSNVNLSRDLGMRHRAGIGMSEHSDAVVVIVSEETGSISAATGGMLKRHLAPETLERLLRNELLSEQEEVDRGTPLSGLLSGLLPRRRRVRTDDGASAGEPMGLYPHLRAAWRWYSGCISGTRRTPP